MNSAKGAWIALPTAAEFVVLDTNPEFIMTTLEKPYRLYHVLLLSLGVFYVLTFIFANEIDSITQMFVEELRWEYRVAEQLSKFYLLVMMLANFLALYRERSQANLRFIAVFLAFSVTLYVSESDMIKEKLQPLFALILLLPILYWFLSGKKILATVALFLGLGSIFMGVSSDFIGESEWIAENAPKILISMTQLFHEETWDCLGVSFLALSSLLVHKDALADELTENGIVIISLFFIVFFVAIGNGFSHPSYGPSTALWLTGLSLTLFGFLLFFVLTRFSSKPNINIISMFPIKFYLCCAFIFVVMPSFLTKRNYAVSLILWLLIIYCIYKVYCFLQDKLTSESK